MPTPLKPVQSKQAINIAFLLSLHLHLSLLGPSETVKSELRTLAVVVGNLYLNHQCNYPVTCY